MDPIPGYSSAYTLLSVNEFARPWIITNTNVAMTLAACAGWFTLYALLSRKIKRPPGPRRFPFIGNALQIPQSFQWLDFSRWAKKYGTRFTWT
jgi:hypothetical protein